MSMAFPVSAWMMRMVWGQVLVTDAADHALHAPKLDHPDHVVPRLLVAEARAAA